MHKWINLLQEGSGDDGKHPRDMTLEPAEYDNVVVADDRYNIGCQVRIIENNKYITNKNTHGHSGSGAVVMCADENKMNTPT